MPLPTISALLAATLLPGQVPNSDKAAKIAEIVEHFHEYGMFNGGVLVKDAGTEIFRRVAGMADFRTGRALRDDTPFYLGSVSKQFTATAILLLAEDGELAVQDRLAQHLPAFSGFADDVTIHHLLTHTSGVPDHFNELAVSPIGLTNADIVEALLAHGRLNFPPGARFSYSNGGYTLLAEIVRECSGKSLGEFAHERIFEPLGMRHTQFGEPGVVIENRAIGFDLVGIDDGLSQSTGAGGLFSTLADLSRWDDAIHAGELMTAHSWKVALTPHVKMSGNGPSYGYGWMLRPLGRDLIVSHAGRLGGHQCMVMTLLHKQHTIMMLTNQGEATARSIVDGIRDVLMGREPRLQRIGIGAHLAQHVREHGIDEAMQRYEQVLAGERERFDFGESELNQLGYAFLRAGQIDNALRVLQRNAQQFPQSGNAYDSLAEALARSGDRREAIRNYGMSLKLDPDNVHAIDMLQQLRGK